MRFARIPAASLCQFLLRYNIISSSVASNYSISGAQTDLLLILDLLSGLIEETFNTLLRAK
jgi:hypothetical protein